jgi:hypothetical protein
MKYEAPELMALTPAINAVQTSAKPDVQTHQDSDLVNEIVGAYADWEI